MMENDTCTTERPRAHNKPCRVRRYESEGRTGDSEAGIDRNDRRENSCRAPAENPLKKRIVSTAGRTHVSKGPQRPGRNKVKFERPIGLCG